MIPQDIVLMLKKPGKYVVSSDPKVRMYSMVEVLPNGNVYQLKPDGVTRDGILSRDGWNPEVKVYTVHTESNVTSFVRIVQP